MREGVAEKGMEGGMEGGSGEWAEEARCPVQVNIITY